MSSIRSALGNKDHIRYDWYDPYDGYDRPRNALAFVNLFLSDQRKR
jgi:hypothetical protein